MNKGEIRLRRWRRRAELSQTEAAEHLRVSLSYFRKLESEHRTPGLKFAHKIYKKCRIDDKPLIPMQAWCERFEFPKRTPVPPPVPLELVGGAGWVVGVGGLRKLRVRDGRVVQYD